MPTIIANAPLLGGNHSIAFEQDRIVSIEPSGESTDLHVGPALFDIQVNGYGGRTCRLETADNKSSVAFITRVFREFGIGWWIPTVITTSREKFETAFRLLGEALDEDPDTAASVPGLHMEGPYVSPDDGPRGAHTLEHTRDPDWDEFQHMQELSGGRILYITLAPERNGAPEFIRKAVAAGVVVSIGHSNLDRDALAAAVDAGATMSTHLGNGAHDMIQRHNNYIWYQLACRRTYASFVADGHHLPDECLYSMVHAKGLDLSIITSDTTRFGGMAPGIYGDIEMLPSGRVNLRGTPNLAGSTNHLLDCVENLERATGLAHADAWRLASINPGRMLGLEARLGLEPGKEASLTVYRYDENGPKIEIVETWVAGRKVFDAATTERVALEEGEYSE